MVNWTLQTISHAFFIFLLQQSFLDLSSLHSFQQQELENFDNATNVTMTSDRFRSLSPRAIGRLILQNFQKLSHVSLSHISLLPFFSSSVLAGYYTKLWCFVHLNGLIQASYESENDCQ